MDSTLSLIAVARRIARLGLMATVALPAVAYAQSTGGSAEGADTAGMTLPLARSL